MYKCFSVYCHSPYSLLVPPLATEKKIVLLSRSSDNDKQSLIFCTGLLTQNSVPKPPEFEGIRSFRNASKYLFIDTGSYTGTVEYSKSTLLLIFSLDLFEGIKENITFSD
jgi:hypothetical protein